MSTDRRTLLTHVVAPIANETDGRRTAAALAAHSPEKVTVLYVVEKSGGGIDPTSPAQSKTVGEAAFAAFRETFPDADGRIVSGTDVTKTIFEAAEDLDGSVIAFVSRGGGGLLQLLSGNVARRLVTENPVPVLALSQLDREADSTVDEP